MVTPAVLVDSTPDTVVALPQPSLPSVTVSCAHSSRLMVLVLLPLASLISGRVDGHQRVVAPAAGAVELRPAAGDQRRLPLRHRADGIAAEAAGVAQAGEGAARSRGAVAEHHVAAAVHRHASHPAPDGVGRI